MGGMMGECMKKFMSSKCGEEMKAKWGCQSEQKEQAEQTEEKKAEEPTQKTFNPLDMMNKFMNSEGGAAMKAKCESKGFNPADMMQKFMGNKATECKPEDMMAMGQKFMGMMGGNGGGNGEWKNKRAKAVNKNHENVMAILPGQTQFAEIEVQNGTQWPWKQGCFFGMDDAKHGDEEVNMPVEPVRVDIPFNVTGN
jgi:hypothetical protein